MLGVGWHWRLTRPLLTRTRTPFSRRFHPTSEDTGHCWPAPADAIASRLLGMTIRSGALRWCFRAAARKVAEGEGPPRHPLCSLVCGWPQAPSWGLGVVGSIEGEVTIPAVSLAALSAR